jgi:hypothetical protein
MQTIVSGKEMHPLKLLVKTSILPALTYKKGALIFVAGPISFFLDWVYTGSFLGFSLTFIALFTGFIIADLFTGVIASRHEGIPIKSDLLSYTFYKFAMYLGFFWMLFEVSKEVEKLEAILGVEFLAAQAKHLLAFIRNFVFIILNLREYISIGENIGRRFGTRPYIFKIVEKIADIIEAKLISKIETADFFPPKKEEPKNEQNHFPEYPDHPDQNHPH